MTIFYTRSARAIADDCGGCARHSGERLAAGNRRACWPAVAMLPNVCAAAHLEAVQLLARHCAGRWCDGLRRAAHAPCDAEQAIIICWWAGWRDVESSRLPSMSKLEIGSSGMRGGLAPIPALGKLSRDAPDSLKRAV